MANLIIGSRGSDLALWQTRWVAANLGVPTDIQIISTQGDRVLDRDLSGMAGKGFFTKELEDALYAKTIDLSPVAEPEIYATTSRFATVVENMVFDPETLELDFADSSITVPKRSVVA